MLRQEWGLTLTRFQSWNLKRSCWNKTFDSVKVGHLRNDNMLVLDKWDFFQPLFSGAVQSPPNHGNGGLIPDSPGHILKCSWARHGAPLASGRWGSCQPAGEWMLDEKQRKGASRAKQIKHSSFYTFSFRQLWEKNQDSLTFIRQWG